MVEEGLEDILEGLCIRCSSITWTKHWSDDQDEHTCDVDVDVNVGDEIQGDVSGLELEKIKVEVMEDSDASVMSHPGMISVMGEG